MKKRFLNREYLAGVGLYVLTSVVSVGLIIYIGYHMFRGLSQKVETVPAVSDALVVPLEADAYLFRDETPLRASVGDASCVPVVPDGAHVAAGAAVVRVYDVSAPDIVAEIQLLEEQIEALRALQQSAPTVRHAMTVENEIYATMQQIAAVGRSGDAGRVRTLRAALLSGLNRRAALAASFSDIDGAIASLSAEKSALTAQLGVSRMRVTAPRSGYYYAACDGYEAYFTAERALHMTPAEFDALIGGEPAAPGAAGKLASDYRWYAACSVARERAAGLRLGGSYDVTFPYGGDRVLEMQLVRREADETRVLLVFGCESLPDGFAFTRAQPISVAAITYEGIRIPTSALRVSEGVIGVYIREGSIVHFRAVRILMEREDVCIVADPPPLQPDGTYREGEAPPEGMRWLALNDIVITQGRNLYEGRILS